MLNNTIKNLKTAFVLFIARVETLTDAIRSNTATVAVNTSEQTLLREQLAAIETNTRFVAHATRQEHARQGHKL